MKRITLTLAALTFVALGCEQSGPTTPNASKSVGTPSFSATSNGRVVGRVSVGGHDIDGSTDKNYSMIALLRADGSADGQWVDMFGGDLGGIHVDVDCVRIVGNKAWVSGIIKNGTQNGVDVTGRRALTEVWDFGTSANDPPDAISYSYITVQTCTYPFDLAQLPMTDGQVTIN